MESRGLVFCVCILCFAGQISWVHRALRVFFARKDEFKSIPQEKKPKSGRPAGNLSCPALKDDLVLEQRGRQKLIMIVGLERSGSTLLASLINELGEPLLYGDEMFHPDPGLSLLPNALLQLARVCQLIEGDEKASRQIKDRIEYFRTTTKSDRVLVRTYRDLLQNVSWAQPFLNFWANRKLHPETLLSFFRNAPSEIGSERLAFKIFQSHMKSVKSFMDAILQLWRKDDVKVVVVWRSRAVESYISLKIALRKREFVGVNTTEKDAIRASCGSVRAYLERWFQYYHDVQKELVARGIPYHVVEYGRDLVDEKYQKETFAQLGRFLNVRKSSEFKSSDVKKQAQVLVEKQVLNWDELEECGFNFDDKDFDKVFSSGKPPWLS